MKSSSITGLSFAFIPGETTDQKTIVSVGAFADDRIVSANNFYLFEGPMPDPTILQTYNDSSKLLIDYTSKLITKITNFDLKYTYDKQTRTRKLQKFPVNAQTMTATIGGTAGWACIEAQALNLSSPFKCLIFTDAVGGWDDMEQSILVSSTTTVAGESITIKDINITLRDAMLIDLTPTI